MNSYSSDENQGALERLGIPVQTTPPEQVLTAGKAKSIRFRVSRPQGYAYGDIESYQFDYVIPTLEWYAETLHQRDLAIHKLGELIDRTEVDLLNAKAQLDNKDYNDAIGLAVEESEKDPEIEALLLKVDDLQSQLAQAYATIEQLQNTPFTDPSGEESYSRAEVEGFLSSAVEDANDAKDKEYAGLLQGKEQEYRNALEQAKEEARLEALSASPHGFTEEEVRIAIDSAVSEAVTTAESAKDLHYTALLNSRSAATTEAVAKAREAERLAAAAEARASTAEARAQAAESRISTAESHADEAEARAQAAESRISTAEARAQAFETRTQEAEARAMQAEMLGTSNASSETDGYSQEEVEGFIAAAVAAREAELLAQFPEIGSIDEIAELTNEGDLRLKVENKTLKKNVEDMNSYAKELEDYIRRLEGGGPAPAEEDTLTSPDGRPLTKLRPEDL